MRQGQSRNAHLLSRSALKGRIQPVRAANQKSGVATFIHPTLQTLGETLCCKFGTSLVKGDYSWRRPNKRMIGSGLYFPSHNMLPQMGTVVIQSDESGSIGDKEREHFAGHINKILETCRPEKIIVLHTDTQVHKHVDEYELQDLPIKFKTYCCGGTDMRAGYEWVNKNNIEPEIFITLTDGYSPWPDKPTPYPSIVLCTTDAQVNFGEVIRYEIT